MLVYKIKSRKAKPNVEQSTKAPLGTEHILRSQIRKCSFKVGDKVRIRGAGMEGVVNGINTDSQSVKWLRNYTQPCIVSVAVDIGTGKVEYESYPLKSLRKVHK